MIELDQLRTLREVIEDTLEECQGQDSVALAESLEHALLVIAAYRKAQRIAASRVNIQLDYTQ